MCALNMVLFEMDSIYDSLKSSSDSLPSYGRLVYFCENLKIFGPCMERTHKCHLDKYFDLLRNKCCSGGLPSLTKFHFLEVIELRAMRWEKSVVHSTYYEKKNSMQDCDYYQEDDNFRKYGNLKEDDFQKYNNHLNEDIVQQDDNPKDCWQFQEDDNLPNEAGIIPEESQNCAGNFQKENDFQDGKIVIKDDSIHDEKGQIQENITLSADNCQNSDLIECGSLSNDQDTYLEKDDNFQDTYLEEDGNFRDTYLEEAGNFRDTYLEKDDNFRDTYLEKDDNFRDTYLERDDTYHNSNLDESDTLLNTSVQLVNIKTDNTLHLDDMHGNSNPHETGFLQATNLQVDDNFLDTNLKEGDNIQNINQNKDGGPPDINLAKVHRFQDINLQESDTFQENLHLVKTHKDSNLHETKLKDNIFQGNQKKDDNFQSNKNENNGFQINREENDRFLSDQKENDSFQSKQRKNYNQEENDKFQHTNSENDNCLQNTKNVESNCFEDTHPQNSNTHEGHIQLDNFQEDAYQSEYNCQYTNLKDDNCQYANLKDDNCQYTILSDDNCQVANLAHDNCQYTNLSYDTNIPDCNCQVNDLQDINLKDDNCSDTNMQDDNLKHNNCSTNLQDDNCSATNLKHYNCSDTNLQDDTSLEKGDTLLNTGLEESDTLQDNNLQFENFMEDVNRNQNDNKQDENLQEKFNFQNAKEDNFKISYLQKDESCQKTKLEGNAFRNTNPQLLSNQNDNKLKPDNFLENMCRETGYLEDDVINLKLCISEEDSELCEVIKSTKESHIIQEGSSKRNINDIRQAAIQSYYSSKKSEGNTSLAARCIFQLNKNLQTRNNLGIQLVDNLSFGISSAKNPGFDIVASEENEAGHAPANCNVSNYSSGSDISKDAVIESMSYIQIKSSSEIVANRKHAAVKETSFIPENETDEGHNSINDTPFLKRNCDENDTNFDYSNDQEDRNNNSDDVYIQNDCGIPEFKDSFTDKHLAECNSEHNYNSAGSYNGSGNNCKDEENFSATLDDFVCISDESGDIRERESESHSEDDSILVLEYRYTLTLGKDYINIMATNLDFLRTAKMALEEYFRNNPLYTDIGSNRNHGLDESGAFSLQSLSTDGFSMVDEYVQLCSKNLAKCPPPTYHQLCNPEASPLLKSVIQEESDDVHFGFENLSRSPTRANDSHCSSSGAPTRADDTHRSSSGSPIFEPVMQDNTNTDGHFDSENCLKSPIRDENRQSTSESSPIFEPVTQECSENGSYVDAGKDTAAEEVEIVWCGNKKNDIQHNFSKKCHRISYSREFIIRRANFPQSRRTPKNWSTIIRMHSITSVLVKKYSFIRDLLAAMNENVDLCIDETQSYLTGNEFYSYCDFC